MIGEAELGQPENAPAMRDQQLKHRRELILEGFLEEANTT